MIKTLLRKIHRCKQIIKQEKNENKKIKPKKLKNIMRRVERKQKELTNTKAEIDELENTWRC